MKLLKDYEAAFINLLDAVSEVTVAMDKLKRAQKRAGIVFLMANGVDPEDARACYPPENPGETQTDEA